MRFFRAGFSQAFFSALLDERLCLQQRIARKRAIVLC
jgi:hypothetical protein